MSRCWWVISTGLSRCAISLNWLHAEFVEIFWKSVEQWVWIRCTRMRWTHIDEGFLKIGDSQQYWSLRVTGLANLTKSGSKCGNCQTKGERDPHNVCLNNICQYNVCLNNVCLHILQCASTKWRWRQRFQLKLFFIFWKKYFTWSPNCLLPSSWSPPMQLQCGFGYMVIWCYSRPATQNRGMIFSFSCWL